MDLTNLREEARQRNLLPELEKEFESCEATLKRIDAGSLGAMQQIVIYYEGQHQPLQAKVTGRGPMKSTLPGGLVGLLKNKSKG